MNSTNILMDIISMADNMTKICSEISESFISDTDTEDDCSSFDDFSESKAC